MKDGDKTKKQLIKELAELRRRVAGLDVPENEHAREEEALRDSEGRFRAVFETAQDSIFIKDRALRYILVNPAMERLFELPAAKLVGLTDRDLFGEDAGAFISKVDSRVLGGETVKAEHAKPVKGAVKTFDVIKVPIRDRTGNVVGLCGIARDITERKRADDELKGMTSSLQALVQTIPDVVYFKDLQGRNLVVNGAFEKLAGLKAAEIIGKTDELFFPPELARQCKFSDDEVMRSQKTLRFEEQAADRDGKKIFFETIKTPLYDDHGKVVGLVGVSRDVTERKTAEEALRESQGQLRSLAVHLQQIQEKERSRIARDIHDEFGQLLTAMKYDLSWMKRRLHEDQEPLVEMSEKMSKLIENAVKTVQRISSELRPALLDDLGLVAAIEWYAGEYQDRTGTKCAVTADPDEIILDRELSTAVFRAFQEALTNVARHADATKVEVSLKKDDRELVLNVRDDGKGITEEDIFDSKSFGLIGIRERFHPWGGRVEINGIQGKGTSVTINIPLARITRSV